jgi:hypothetical protein
MCVFCIAFGKSAVIVIEALRIQMLFIYTQLFTEHTSIYSIVGQRRGEKSQASGDDESSCDRTHHQDL